MNKIPELNPIEKKLKQFYRKSRERMLDVPCTRDEIMDVRSVILYRNAG